MSSDKPKTAKNIVPFVVLAILIAAGIIYSIASKEATDSGIAQEEVRDAKQVEEVLEKSHETAPAGKSE
ncbi:MAG: hypothetical protein U9R74_01010 [Pseudomonadota bacterium]|nr:hypothetical protein [Pseudomonadota bacterium]